MWPMFLCGKQSLKIKEAKYLSMNSRRQFIKQVALGAAYLPVIGVLGCTKSKEATIPPLKISLAQWSMHRALEAGTLKAIDFPAIARGYGFEAVEYVNGFYRDHAEDEAYWANLKKIADDQGVKNLLIMVDEEGDLGNTDATAQKQAVENHYKWIRAASVLGCHSIRVNAFGEGSKEEVQKAMIDSMSQLSTYAKAFNLNVIIENHGLYSSDGIWIAEIMKQVNLPNCGTLPDFGNWCLSAKWGTTQIACEQVYDRYKGVKEMLPFAKGVSAKSYAFDAEGNETRIDYKRMLQIVKDAGFDGYVGVEFEGFDLGEPEGIKATKSLLEKQWQAIHEG